MDFFGQKRRNETFRFKIGLFSYPVSMLLGGITRDEQTGKILSATSAMHVWITSVDLDAKQEDSSTTGIELDLADAASLQWEAQLVEAILAFDESSPDLGVLANVGRRYRKPRISE